MKQIKYVQVEEIGFHEGLQRDLSTYLEKTFHENGSVIIEQVNNPYFLVNDKWNVNVVGEIKQFKEVERTIAVQVNMFIFNSINLRLI